jgi:hypothetical protein
MRTTFKTRIGWKNSGTECYYYDPHRYNIVDAHNTFTAHEKESLELFEKILDAKDRKSISKSLVVDALGLESTLAMETMRILL